MAVLQPKDLQSTIEMLVELQDNKAWKDVIALMKDRIDYIRELMDDESDILNIRLYQGEILALKHFIQSPDTLIHNLQVDAISVDVNKKEEK